MSRARLFEGKGRSVPPALRPSTEGSGGAPLEGGLRQRMEASFGRDFSGVRVHSDGESTSRLDAAAFASGQDLVFRPGLYRPGTPAGDWLVAHELTHVVQQAGGRGGSANAEGPFERQADGAAEAAAAGRPVGSLQSLGVAPGLQRVGLIEWVKRLFGGGTFDPAELTTYLDALDARNPGGATGWIEDHLDSDNKARAIVKRWRAGEAAFNLDTGHGHMSVWQQKTLLILELQSGYLADDDAEAILALVEHSAPDQVRAMVDPLHGVQASKLARRMGEAQQKRFMAALQAAGPVPGAEHVLTQGNQACDPAEAAVIARAQQEAKATVQHSAEVLRSRPASAQGPVQDWFTGADAATVQARILPVFDHILAKYPTRFFACQDGDAPVQSSLNPGQKVKNVCSAGEHAASLVTSGGAADVRTFFCPDFFQLEDLAEQTGTLIHEWTHQSEAFTDMRQPPFRPGQVPLSDALRNPESFARLALALKGIP